jgi:hypothetical protein
MARTTRRVLPCVLALALALTACGRSSPNVTAEDGRGDRTSSGIWIPETRDVDPGRDMRSDDEDEQEDTGDAPERDEADADEDGAGDGSRLAASDADGSETASGASATPTRTGSRSTSTSSGRDASASSEPRRSGGSGPGEPRDEAEDDEEPTEPTDPEVVGDCGTAASGPEPTEQELETAVDELRTEIERRWPQTQAGAWIMDEPRQVHVGFTRAVGSRLEQLCPSFDYPHLLHGARTVLSDAELQEFLEVVEDDRDDLREGRARRDLPEPIRATEGRYVASVEHARNGLVVTVERRTHRLVEAFRTHYTPQLHLVEGEFDEHGEPVDDA